MSSFPERETDCTYKCRSHKHALQLSGAIVRGSFDEIRAFSKWLCCNFSCVTDVYGRNVLHVAASCGKCDTLRWLLKQCHADVDVKDLESGWTALHRSLFYGNLLCAKILAENNASFQTIDHEGLTPLEIVAKDRPSYVTYSPSDPSEVYVWGSNLNFNLGLGNEQERTTPELLETFRRDNISISKVGMCKYHTVFMSNDGRIFSCGLGHSGRLGIGHGETSILPKPIKRIESRCTDFATAEDHMLLLTESGRVWSCGQNTYHQLGHIPPPQELLSPRPVSSKLLSSSDTIGVCAARYHSVIFTRNSIYSFGLNAGQLGHPRGEKFQTCPREVSSLKFKNCQLSLVAVSDGSTVCTTSKGEIYVLHQYQCRKIASKQMHIKKICVIGGHLDSSWCITGESDFIGKHLTVLLLANSGKLFIWQESVQFIQRCIFTHPHQLIISDISLNITSVGLISTDGLSFIGYLAQGKVVKEETTTPTKSGTSLIPLLDRENCKLIRVKRVPFIHRGTSITSDLKGVNFAVIQSHPKTYLLELPLVSTTEISNEMKKFYKVSNIDDGICDVIITTGNRKFPAHKYILASRSSYFRKQLTQAHEKQNELVIDFIRNDVFEQVFEFIYTNNCALLEDAKNIKLQMDKLTNFEPEFKSGRKSSKQSKKVPTNPLEELFQRTVEACSKLGISSLTEGLKSFHVVGSKIQRLHEYSPPKMSFSPDDLTEMCDISLRSCDDVEFHCHKCILIARVDYFSSMLSASWIESSSASSISLPFSAKVLGVVINFIYTDDSAKLFESEDAEFLCQVLVAADHMFILRLKEMCEVALVDMITLKNVTELLELSHIYRAAQLKTTCTQYINLNLPALLEANSFETLSDEVIEELSKNYKHDISGMCRRHLTPYSCGPTDKELEWVSVNFPVDEDAKHYNPEGKIKSKRKFRSRKISAEPEEGISKVVGIENPASPSNNFLSFEGSDCSEPATPEQKNTISTNLEQVAKYKPFKGKWNVSQATNQVPNFRDILLNEEQNLKTKARVLFPAKHAHSSQKQMNTKQKLTEKSLASFGIARSPPATQFWSTPDVSVTYPENPWKKITATPSTTLVMKDIISSEMEKQQGLLRLQTKSFDLISAEEKAMEELLLLYNAAECIDEKITVERVLPERVAATPMWVKQ